LLVCFPAATVPHPPVCFIRLYHIVPTYIILWKPKSFRFSAWPISWWRYTYTIIFVVITALHNIGGSPRNHSFSNGRRPPLLENGRFPARRHWPDDFPFRSPRALRPVPSVSSRHSSFALSVFTFRAFRIIFFFYLSVL